MFRSHSKDVGAFTVTVGHPHPRWVTIEHRRGGTIEALNGLSLEDVNDLIYALERTTTLAKVEDDEWTLHNQSNQQ